MSLDTKGLDAATQVWPQMINDPAGETRRKHLVPEIEAYLENFELTDERVDAHAMTLHLRVNGRMAAPWTEMSLNAREAMRANARINLEIARDAMLGLVA